MTQELKNRLTWGIGAAILLLIVIFLLGPECTFLAATGAAMLGWREYTRMMGIKDRLSYYLTGFLLVLVMFTHGYFMGPKSFFWLWAVWLLGFFILFFEHRAERRAGSTKAFDPSIAWTQLCRFVLGIFYIFLLFGFIGPIAARENGEKVLLFSLLVVFVGDTASYFVGRSRGKTKLWPELSPGKTVEGAIGGWIGSFLVAVISWAAFRYLGPKGGSLPLVNCLIIGILAPPLAQAGDFMESLMKRAAGCKDSGTLLPGHGGILDRSDGLVFVMPLIYFLF